MCYHIDRYSLYGYYILIIKTAYAILFLRTPTIKLKLIGCYGHVLDTSGREGRWNMSGFVMTFTATLLAGVIVLFIEHAIWG